MQFFVRRLFTLLLTIFVVTLLTFVVFRILPGDPALVMLGTEADAEAIEALRQQLGMEGSLLTQYFTWVSKVIRGNLGESLRLSQPVTKLIIERLPLTGALTLLSIILVIACSIPLGIYAALHRGSRLDFIIQSVSQLGLAVPFFWAGIMLILLFSLRLRWFPPGGFTPWSESVSGALLSLVLPAVALALPRIAIMTRLTRSSVLDVISSEYVLTARSKGISSQRVIFVHVLRNALIPVVTMLGIHLTGLLAGSIVAEEVFSLPGMGRLLLAGIGYRDLPLVQGLVLSIAVLVLVVNFLIDLVYLWIEPRMHYS